MFDEGSVVFLIAYIHMVSSYMGPVRGRSSQTQTFMGAIDSLLMINHIYPTSRRPSVAKNAHDYALV